MLVLNLGPPNLRRGHIFSGKSLLVTCLSVSEGLCAASALCVASSNAIVICEQKMHVTEASMLFLTTTFVKICAQSTCWVLRVRIALRWHFACFISIEMMSQTRRSDIFTGTLVVKVLMTQTQSRSQLEFNVLSQVNRGLSLRCRRPRTIT